MVLLEMLKQRLMLSSSVRPSCVSRVLCLNISLFVFHYLDPFANVDLTTVSQDVIETINTMREAAESAETDQFDPEIDAASGAEADALQVGKIKNKVLKLTAEVQVLNIKVGSA
jgi:hypothetical protein